MHAREFLARDAFNFDADASGAEAECARQAVVVLPDRGDEAILIRDACG